MTTSARPYRRRASSGWVSSRRLNPVAPGNRVRVRVVEPTLPGRDDLETSAATVICSFFTELERESLMTSTMPASAAHGAVRGRVRTVPSCVPTIHQQIAAAQDVSPSRSGWRGHCRCPRPSSRPRRIAAGKQHPLRGRSRVHRPEVARPHRPPDLACWLRRPHQKENQMTTSR